jgi:hypothetical protein
MERKENGCKVECMKMNSRDVIRISIDEMLTEKMAKDIAEKLVVEFERKGQALFCLIWNCVTMTGYDPSARMNIQKVLKAYHKRIDKSFLISDNKNIKTGGQVLSTFASFNLITVSSESEIKL